MASSVSVRAFPAPLLQPHISVLEISLNRTTLITEFQTSHVNNSRMIPELYFPTHVLLQPLLCRLHLHNSLSYLGISLPSQVYVQLAHSILRTTQILLRQHGHRALRSNGFFFNADIELITTVSMPDHFLGYQVTARTPPTVTTSNVGDINNFNDDNQLIFDEVSSAERSPTTSITRRRPQPIDKLRKTEHELLDAGNDNIRDQLSDGGCCSICLEDYLCDGINENQNMKLVRFGCTHLYHLACILQWLDEKDSCPQCRRRLYKLS